jgi:hypothetical protein
MGAWFRKSARRSSERFLLKQLFVIKVVLEVVRVRVALLTFGVQLV